MSVLAFVAVLQILAVAWRYAPVISQHMKDAALNAQAPTAPPVLNEPTPPAVSVAPPALPPANAQQIKQLLDDASLKFRVGEFDAALKILSQLETLSPNDPTVLYSKAQVLEKLDQRAEAVVVLETLLKIPGLPADYRGAAHKKLTQLADSLGSSGTPAAATPTTSTIEESGNEMRNAIGIRPGATLGIVDVRTKEARRGVKTLSVSVKSLPGITISSDKVKLMAYVYEETADGEVALTNSNVVGQWVSPPMDWAENEPEIVDLQYTLPENQDIEGAADRKYTGYVLGLYYNGELQDLRSDPAPLVKKFPLPLDEPQ